MRTFPASVAFARFALLLMERAASLSPAAVALAYGASQLASVSGATVALARSWGALGGIALAGLAAAWLFRHARANERPLFAAAQVR